MADEEEKTKPEIETESNDDRIKIEEGGGASAPDSGIKITGVTGPAKQTGKNKITIDIPVGSEEAATEGPSTEEPTTATPASQPSKPDESTGNESPQPKPASKPAPQSTPTPPKNPPKKKKQPQPTIQPEQSPAGAPTEQPEAEDGVPAESADSPATGENNANEAGDKNPDGNGENKTPDESTPPTEKQPAQEPNKSEGANDTAGQQAGGDINPTTGEPKPDKSIPEGSRDMGESGPADTAPDEDQKNQPEGGEPPKIDDEKKAADDLAEKKRQEEIARKNSRADSLNSAISPINKIKSLANFRRISRLKKDIKKIGEDLSDIAKELRKIRNKLIYRLAKMLIELCSVAASAAVLWDGFLLLLEQTKGEKKKLTEKQKDLKKQVEDKELEIYNLQNVFKRESQAANINAGAEQANPSPAPAQ